MRIIINISITIAVLYGVSKLTGIQIPEVMVIAFGLFIIIGGGGVWYERYKEKRRGGYGFMDDGEPGNGE